MINSRQALESKMASLINPPSFSNSTLADVPQIESATIGSATFAVVTDNFLELDTSFQELHFFEGKD